MALTLRPSSSALSTIPEIGFIFLRGNLCVLIYFLHSTYLGSNSPVLLLNMWRRRGRREASSLLWCKSRQSKRPLSIHFVQSRNCDNLLGSLFMGGWTTRGKRAADDRTTQQEGGAHDVVGGGGDDGNCGGDSGGGGWSSEVGGAPPSMPGTAALATAPAFKGSL